MKRIKKSIETLRQKVDKLVETQPNNSTSYNSIEAELLKTIHLLELHQLKLEAQNNELHQTKIAVQDAVDLYDFAPIGYFTLSSFSEIVNLNLCGANMLCKERSLSKDSLFGNVVSDNTKPIFYQFLDRVFSSKVQETCNVTIISNCKMPMYVHLTGIIAQNDKHCYVTAVDISELRRVEGNLLESEEKFQVIIQSQSEGIGVVNANEIFEFANFAANKIFDVDNLIGKSLFDFLTPTENDSIIKQTENRQQGNSGSYELQIVTKKGERKQILVSTTPKFDLHNNYQGAYGIFIDITERKLAEKKLQESEALYHSILMASPDSITITDLDGNILFISPKTINMFGFEKAEQLLNQNINDFIVPEDRERVQAEIIRMYQDIFTGPAEYKAIKADKSIFDIDVNAEVIRNADGELTKMVFIVRDITERKKAERLRDQQLYYTKALNEIAEIIISYDVASELLDNVNKVLGRTLQVDRSLIYNILFDKQEIEGLCEWLRFEHPDITATKAIYPLDMFKAPLTELFNSKKYIISQFDAVNGHFIQDGSGEVLHQQMNIKSLIWYPFSFYDNNCYIFTLNQILESRQWTTEEISFLESVGKQINLALQKSTLLEERKIAQQELTKFHTISDQANYGAFICSMKGDFTYMNDTFANMLGWDSTELLGKNFNTILSDHQLSRSIEIKHLIDTKGGFAAEEIYHTRKDGTVIPTLMSVKIIFDENNVPQYISGTFIDITKKKKDEEELRKLSQAVEQSPVSIVITNIDGEIEYANPKSCETTGYTLEELMGKNPSVLQSGETPKDEYSALWNTIGTGNEWHGTFHNKKKTGELYWESSTIAPVLDSEGKITNYVAIKEDITERKKADEEIIKFRTIADKANYGTAITTTEGVFIYVNDAFAQMHGLIAKELIGKNISIFHNEEQLQQVGNLIGDLFTKGEFIAKEVWHVRTDGSVFPTLMNGTLILNEKKEPLFFTANAIDITAIKESEDALKRNESNLNFAQEIANMGSWELNLVNNKLTGSRNYYKMLGIDFEEEKEDLYEYFQSIVHPDDVILINRIFEDCIAYRKTVVINMRMILPGKQVVLYQNNIVPIFEGNDLIALRGVNIDITEKKQKDDIINKLSLAVTQSPVSVVITSLEGNIEFVNPAFEVITGYKALEVIGKNTRILKSGENDEKMYADLWLTISKGKVWESEWVNLKKNGELYWEHISISPIQDETGKTISYLAIKQDISERKQSEKYILEINETLEQKVEDRTLQLAETNTSLTKEIDERKRIQEALSESEKSYRTVVENVNEVIFQTDADGLWLFLNKSWESVTGFSIDESIGQSFTNFVHPEDRQYNMELFEPLILRQKEYCRHQVRYLTKAGGFRWIEVFARPALNENDEIIGTYGTLQDITERKHAEELLLWNKSLLELMSNASPLGFLVVDNRTDDILYFNQQFCKIWDIEHLMAQMHNGEFKNNDIIPYCLPVLADVPAFAASCAPLQDENNHIVVSDEIPFTENRTIHRYTTQIRGNNDEYYGRFYIFEDITERKRTEEFEDELLNLSIQMNGIPDSEISNAINNALSKIGTLLDADRAYIFELNADEATMDNTYEWCKDGIVSEIANRKDISVDIFPMWMKALRRNENVIIPDVKKLPDTWNVERKILEPNGILSLTVVPISSNNILIGYVGLDAVIQKKEYNDSEINNLMVWSNMLSGILNKQRNNLILNQTRQNYETFFNTIDDFLFVLDENGNILHANQIVLDRLEYENKELIDKHILLVHPAERREEAGRIVGEMLSGTTEFCPVPLFTKTGKYIPVETRIKPGFWDGKPVIFGVSKDMSKIQLSEEKFSKAFHSNSALMAINGFDDDVFIDVNDIFLKKLGYSKDEIIGNSSINLNLFEDLVLDRSPKLNKNVQIRDVELQLKTKSGEMLTGLVSTERIYVGDQLCLLTLIIDITERKKAEEETRKARLEADTANTAKSEFLSCMSHELRTPLNSILGFAQLLGMGELNLKQERGVNHILNSGKHLLTLIDEVLDISRIEAGKLEILTEPVEVQPIIEEILDSIQPLLLAKELTIKIQNSIGNQLFVMCDKKALKQVLINLLNNAVKYNKEGGSITVNTSLMPQNNANDIVVRVSISDTGLGIESESIPKLFVPFERIGAEKTKTEGTGLGLAVVKKLMDAMEGRIGIDSIVGEGSTFWIELPFTENEKSWNTQNEDNKKLTEALNTAEKELVFQNDEKVKRASELDIANIELTFQNKEKKKRAIELDSANNEIATLKHHAKQKAQLRTILYIEDTIANVELVEQILKSQRREVHLISNENGKMATSLAIEYAPDLILLDLNLPDIQGTEVLRLLQDNVQTKDIPVVIITSDAMPRQIEKLLSGGAKKYMTKPLEVMTFLSVINEYIK